MSKNRKYTRAIQEKKRIQGECHKAKKIIEPIYFSMKYDIQLGTKLETMNQAGVVERMMAAKKEIDKKLPRGAAKSGYQLARVAYFYILDKNMAKLGGPSKSADDLFDEAIREEVMAEGKDPATINEALKMMGLLPPEGSGPAGATAAPADATADHAPDTAPQPRFRRTYDTPPADEGPAGAASDAPDSPDRPTA